MTREEFKRKFRRTPVARPELTLLTVFLAAIAIGAGLLALPVSSRAGMPHLAPLDALFMSTSATCVTGLAVVDVASQFSAFGQAVILFLIQLGGVGIMTFAAFFMVVLGRELTAKSEALISSTIGGEENRSLRYLLKSTIGMAFGCELAGAAVLAWHAHGLGHSWPSALWHGLFQAVSAFCNAGISIEHGGIATSRTDWVVMGVTAILVVAGSLGFVVLSELANRAANIRGTGGRLSLHTVIVLEAMAVLCAVGFASFAIVEWGQSLAGMGAVEKTAVAAFQAVASRTSGFAPVDMAATSPVTKFATTVLIFIGGAPGSAAGGIKSTTAAILVLTMAAVVRGERCVSVRMRTIPAVVTGQAVASFMTMVFLALATAIALLVTEGGRGADPASLIFEAVSACSTTGLSLGATGTLSPAGRIVTVAAMYVGRIGPLTAAFLVGRAGGRDMSLTRFPEEDVIVG